MDASIDHETGWSGIGVYSSTAQQRIQNGTTTCKVEILAIDRAITERTNNTDKLIIIADSRSALEKITRSGINAKKDKITMTVRRKLIDAKARNKYIKLIWVPSHTGGTGNERADNLANEDWEKQRTIQNEIHYTELYQNIKKYLKNVWCNIYNQQTLIERLKGKIAPPITVQKIITYPNAAGAKLLIEHLKKNKIKL
ncbi:hypothetical protein JTB14_033448 [Gonioctena quinquepunctata]|nr:hypothetical protein JTB14_033448 [Gonioctena quinquepunctata]